MKKLLVLCAALLWSSVALAQVQVQQSPTAINAATAICAPSASLAVAQQETVTCTPPAGMFVYITSVAFDVCSDGTGVALNQSSFTTTNITGNPVFGFSIALTVSICQHWSIPFATPLKSTAAGTAVTFVSPTSSAHNSFHTTAVVYYAP